MAQAHKDHSRTPLPKKLGIREGARVHVAGADAAGRLWAAWPKKVASLPSDLDLDTVTEQFQGLHYLSKDRSR